METITFSDCLSNFLTFKTFISSDALIMFYYLGAIILPIFSWVLLTWIIRKYKLLKTSYTHTNELLWKILTRKQKAKFILFFLIVFIFMELFWRMLFEFLIAYMQIRDALLQI
ncbi:DUF4282 domain-containing protein [Poseidonibacter ostreae]|uniref:DUF4282 domain-containing protein n=1 Tax=Poseidonibacter ostreae TaxID=2654171 RepID=A0A6L4WPP9_9BACT|nr:DUF4282 domain-containing protein [Poseidonibacter ostreae]KAB7886113.1 DUF4282 domain-containing protein [Poseidonibacter ostreae]KAB7889801.1 DUF4282 domain-containing protein [Poseidonibacter ostreae]